MTVTTQQRSPYLGLTGGWLTLWITIACATDMSLSGYDQGVFSGVVVSPDFLKVHDLVRPTKTKTLSTVAAISDIGSFFFFFCTPNVTAHYADVADPDSVDEAVAEIISKHGQIDNLVTSAGFTENFDAISYPHDRMQRLWGVVVDGTYLFATRVARHLIKRQAPGNMVLIGSMSGSIVNMLQPQAPYNAAKAAVSHLAASLVVEWAGHQIRVDCISPGYILTALTRKILNENPDLREKWTSLIPVGSMGTPEDLMGPVAFLLSDASGYITGTNLRVDGGYTLT